MSGRISRSIDLAKDAVNLGFSNPSQFATVTWLSAISRLPIGTNVFTREWDVLILLDTCRPDALGELSDEFEFLPKVVPSIWSVGGNSPEWIANTFNPKYVEEVVQTSYITGNAWAERVLDEGWSPAHWAAPNAPFHSKTLPGHEIGNTVHIWKYAKSNYQIVDFPHPDPVDIIDFAIHEFRERRPKRMIVHLMEPHQPYLANAEQNGRKELRDYESEPWEYLKDGGDVDKVWQSYISELRKGLNAVDILLKNIDAQRIIISSDHGEAFGEWGDYGHIVGSINPKIRRVPWVETTAHNLGSRTPDIDLVEDTMSAIEQLEALGYR